MVNINIKKEEERVKVSELREGEFFLFKFGGKEYLCQILVSGNIIKTNADFPIAFVYTKTGDISFMNENELVSKVDVEINVTLSK